MSSFTFALYYAQASFIVATVMSSLTAFLFATVAHARAVARDLESRPVVIGVKRPAEGILVKRVRGAVDVEIEEIEEDFAESECSSGKGAKRRANVQAGPAVKRRRLSSGSMEDVEEVEDRERTISPCPRRNAVAGRSEEERVHAPLRRVRFAELQASLSAEAASTAGSVTGATSDSAVETPVRQVGTSSQTPARVLASAETVDDFFTRRVRFTPPERHTCTKFRAFAVDQPFAPSNQRVRLCSGEGENMRRAHIVTGAMRIRREGSTEWSLRPCHAKVSFFEGRHGSTRLEEGPFYRDEKAPAGMLWARDERVGWMAELESITDGEGTQLMLEEPIKRHAWYVQWDVSWNSHVVWYDEFRKVWIDLAVKDHATAEALKRLFSSWRVQCPPGIKDRVPLVPAPPGFFDDMEPDGGR